MLGGGGANVVHGTGLGAGCRHMRSVAVQIKGWLRLQASVSTARRPFSYRPVFFAGSDVQRSRPRLCRRVSQGGTLLRLVEAIGAPLRPCGAGSAPARSGQGPEVRCCRAPELR